MLTTMLIAAVDVNALGTLGASLDVSHIAAATLPPCRRCQVKGALLDELLLVTGLAALLQTNCV